MMSYKIISQHHQQVSTGRRGEDYFLCFGYSTAKVKLIHLYF